MAEVSFLIGVLGAAVTAATPLLLASLGEIISERAGVLNLGVEGIMLVGAFTGYFVTTVTQNPYLGLLAGSVCGAALATIHAFLTISLKADQVISGVMLTLLGTGLTTFAGNALTMPPIDGFGVVSIPVIGPSLKAIPVLGPVLFESTSIDLIAIVLVPVVWYGLYRTQTGLKITAIGEDPKAADTMGVPVFRLRYLCVLLGGFFAGAAGAHLSLAFAKIWAAGMVSGRGWIAIALVIFAQWRPFRALFGAYFFGLIAVLASRLQSFSVSGLDVGGVDFGAIVNFLLHPTIMAVYPYIATIILLTIISRRALHEEVGAPSALLEPYIRE